MKLSFRGCFCLVVLYVFLPAIVQAQNWTSVTAANITDLNQQKLAAGQLCFLATDQNDNPISISVGGGGQLLRRAFCSAIANGAVTAFSVPNPAASAPAGIYYRVTVNDSSLGKEVLRYTQVTFTGTTFSFDNYAPINLGSFAPLTGNSVSGNLSVSGNVAATGTVTGTNIPASIPGAGACTNKFVTGLNIASGPSCGSTATDIVGNQSANGTDALSGVRATDTAPTGNFINFKSAALASLFKVDILGNVLATAFRADGTQSAPAYAYASETGSGWFLQQAGIQGLARQGTYLLQVNGTVFSFANTQVLGFSSGAPNAFSADVGISRCAAGVVCVGNSGQGNTAGTFEGRNLKLDGSTSGSIVVGVPVVAGSNTATLPANTGTVAETNLAQTWSAAQTHNSGTLVLAGATSGTVTVNAPAVAGANTATLPAATGNLVLDSATQTLTNKTLTSAGSGNIVTLLSPCTFGASSAIAGTGTAANFFTCTVPGGTFASGKGMRIELFFSHSTGTAAVTYAISYAGASNSILISSATGVITATLYLMNNPGVTNAQTVLSKPYFNGTAIAGGPFSISFVKDSTVNQTLSFTFNVAATDQVTPLGMITEVIQ